MKTFTYVAAVALLTAGTAFAQSSGTTSTDNTMQKPAQSQSMPNHDMSGSGMSQDRDRNMSGQGMSGDSSRSAGSMDRDMHTNQSSNADIDHNGNMANSASAPRPIARNHARAGSDARENRETAELNMRQVQGGGMSTAGMNSSAPMRGQTAQTPFNQGSPQTPRAGMMNCTPDRPDCGTARQNPSIQSSPQQRTNNASPQ